MEKKMLRARMREKEDVKNNIIDNTKTNEMKKPLVKILDIETLKDPHQ